MQRIETVADACIFHTGTLFIICFGHIPKDESARLFDRVQIIAELENQCGIDTSGFSRDIQYVKRMFKKEAFTLKQARFIAHNF